MTKAPATRHPHPHSIQPCTPATLEALSPLERFVAFILAVHYVPMGKRELAGAVSFIDIATKFQEKLSTPSMSVAGQVERVFESLKALVGRGIVVEHSSMWMCSWSAHPVICGALRSAPETLSVVRAAMRQTVPSAQFRSQYILKEGMQRWNTLLDNTFIEAQLNGGWSRLPSSNRLLEKLFSVEQLAHRWYGMSIEEQFGILPAHILTVLLDDAVHEATREKVPMRPWIELIERFFRAHEGDLSTSERLVLAFGVLRAGYPHLTVELLANQSEESFELSSPFPSRLEVLAYQLFGTIHFLRGDYDKASGSFDIALKMMRSVFGSKHVDTDDFGFLHLLSLLRQNSTKSLKQLHRLVANAIQEGCLVDTLSTLGRHAEALLGVRKLPLDTGDELVRRAKPPSSFILRWCSVLPLILESGGKTRESLLPELLELYHDAVHQQHPLMVDWCARSLADLGYENSEVTVAESGYLAEHSFCYPLSASSLPPIWEAQCKQLAALGGSNARKRRNAHRRVAWVITLDRLGDGWIVPHEQRRTDTGWWEIGDRFENEIPQELISELDRRALSSAGHYDHAILATAGAVNLIGHPHVYLKKQGSYVPTTLHLSSPRLVIKRAKARDFTVSLRPPLPRDLRNKTSLLDLSTPSRIGICTITPALQRIAAILGPEGIEIPDDGRDRLAEIVRNLSPLIPIEHDITAYAEPSSSVAQPTAPLIAQLKPLEPTGLALRFLSRPDSTTGLEYVPGDGPPFINWHQEGELCTIRRSLVDEKAQMERIIAQCDAATERTLSDAHPHGSGSDKRDTCTRGHLPYSWLVFDPEQSLKVLATLADLPHECSMEWPVGQSVRVLGSITPRDFSLVVRKKGELFEVTGSVQINEALVEGFREIISRIDGSNAPFIKVDDKTFISISAHLKAQLRRLKALNASLENGEISLHSLTSDALEEFLSAQPTVDLDKAWSKHVAKMTKLRAVEPTVPPGLTATLRPYQEEGVRWLLRMSTMGAGCCLADDMGLGKTVQALAAMLQRAPEGPTLIVAPTSVCANWIAEAARFAPQLKTSTLPASAENRKSHINALGPNDALVVSYGLIQRGEVTNLLAERHWAQVIIDEAQAIKNSATARTRSIREIPASWRLALSGTPIENRLEELWSIFHFLNPGLLGTTRWFQRRFLEPIERRDDADATESLRAITSPFILRRLKSEVLTDLPPKETITIHVELNEPEAALYEALRREITADLEKLADQSQITKENRLHVFAAMTRLRRLACNAALGTPPQNLPSAKLAACLDIIDELRANGHRALVFSQFVGHLEIVKEALTQRNIPHLYLDGSTAAAARAERVASFQRGEGDIFLISLKAGGVGLNLTAADYVMHLDPWWNPAVLDQATDRAHRIGQQKPVTVYQLISRGTIEEKIIERHERKRALADSILDGADTSAQFSIGELLDMIAEGNVLAGREEDGRGKGDDMAGRSAVVSLEPDAAEGDGGLEDDAALGNW